MSLIEKMKAKLERLEQEYQALFVDDPRYGHGGTPFINNSKGRAMKRITDKLDERRMNKWRQIKEQKEKIARAEDRAERASTQTKKSEKFIEKNPIHLGLFELEKQGLVKQWVKNPMYFFVVGLQRVALCTFDGKIALCSRFPPKNDLEKMKAEELIQIATSFS